MPDGSSTLPTPLAFADKETALRRAFSEDEMPRCEECGEEDDNLERGLCRECEDYSAPTAYELYRDEGTY